MKKHVLPLVAILLLASCTAVKDFGAYWDKGVVDPALEGTWKKIGRPGEELNSVPGPDQLLFAKDGLSYALQAINPLDKSLSAADAARRQKDNDARFAVRSLRIGSHFFFLVRGTGSKPDGMIERYEIQGDVLKEYYLENGAAVEFLEAKHPTARNISGDTGWGRGVTITTFDDEVFRILSEIADDPAYWDLVCQYRKR